MQLDELDGSKDDQGILPPLRIFFDGGKREVGRQGVDDPISGS